jgi:hypothetical protein
MNVDLVLAKREYVLEKGITDKTTIEKIWLIYRDVNEKYQAVFDVYTPLDPVPESWALKKYDTSTFNDWAFPSGTALTEVTVANFINRRTSLGLKPEDVAFINVIDAKRAQVMMSLDSMYFAESFILRTA